MKYVNEPVIWAFASGERVGLLLRQRYRDCKVARSDFWGDPGA
jgi:hypothetical protein